MVARVLYIRSIKGKLTAAMMAVIGIVLILVTLAFVVNEALMFRQAIRRELQILANIIGLNTTAAIIFGDKKSTEATLAGLAARPNLLGAYLLTPDGELFAEYVPVAANAERRTFTAGDKPQQLKGNMAFLAEIEQDIKGVGKWDRDLEVVERIMLDNQVIGIVVLQSDLREIFARLNWFFVLVLIITVFALGVAFLLSGMMLRPISGPILDLASTMRRVSENKEYGLRARQRSDDEIGQLIDGFNDMLALIQQRDAELELRRQHREAELAERKRAENRLRVSAAKLEQTNNELKNFLLVASHDLQEPLRKVMAFGDQVKTKYGKQIGDKGRDYLERMQNAAGGMQVLINDLLTFTRVTTRAQAFMPVDLNAVVQDAISDLEVRITQANGRVDVGALPTIDGDPPQMRQLFQNLIDNAVKFHRKDDAPIVKIHSEFIRDNEGEANGDSGNGGFCQITIADNGVGFDEKYADRVFGVFQRLHGRSEYRGTGIGLAVCRKVVELHGGTITVKSIPGQGTAFMVLLPMRQPEGELWISTENEL
ncbi:MAG: hypothetical protein A2X56_08805 [Nitrospirae bacterium GWC2_57_13]|nr:MAG: hypothetical protein A2X56_08805 [Nitrospirae bacterium GWC2_57_13]OGW40731.1 MAG: hypothetical protein A2X57_04995 [Nitrospirae bacterium GWD2_57_8]HAS53159.1 hypothetical protein [Nitrospiraceae bacterium]